MLAVTPQGRNTFGEKATKPPNQFAGEIVSWQGLVQGRWGGQIGQAYSSHCLLRLGNAVGTDVVFKQQLGVAPDVIDIA
jgi:hypothetical protein